MYMYFIVLCCSVLYCGTVLQLVVLFWTVLYFTVLLIVLSCYVMFCTVMLCSVLYYCTVLHYDTIVLCCAVLYWCTVLYCTCPAGADFLYDLSHFCTPFAVEVRTSGGVIQVEYRVGCQPWHHGGGFVHGCGSDFPLKLPTQ